MSGGRLQSVGIVREVVYQSGTRCKQNEGGGCKMPLQGDLGVSGSLRKREGVGLIAVSAVLHLVLLAQ